MLELLTVLLGLHFLLLKFLLLLLNDVTVVISILIVLLLLLIVIILNVVPCEPVGFLVPLLARLLVQVKGEILLRVALEGETFGFLQLLKLFDECRDVFPLKD